MGETIHFNEENIIIILSLVLLLIINYITCSDSAEAETVHVFP